MFSSSPSSGKYSQRSRTRCRVLFMSLRIVSIVPGTVLETSGSFDWGNNLSSGKSLARKSFVCCWLRDQRTGAVSCVILGSMDPRYTSPLRRNCGGVANYELAGQFFVAGRWHTRRTAHRNSGVLCLVMGQKFGVELYQV